jgi:hypothetical protein
LEEEKAPWGVEGALVQEQEELFEEEEKLLWSLQL